MTNPILDREIRIVGNLAGPSNQYDRHRYHLQSCLVLENDNISNFIILFIYHLRFLSFFRVLKLGLFLKSMTF